MRRPVVAIVGRPNVGKSTLFNRIAGKKIAITEPTPGVTRDRLYANCDWAGKQFVLIDTGGIDFETGGEAKEPADGAAGMSRAILAQSEMAISEADLILFVVDALDGLVPVDREIAGMLRKGKAPVLLVCNKVDSARHELNASEFYELGLGDPVMVSAEHGRNTGDLLDIVVKKLPFEKVAYGEEDSDPYIKIAVVGRPNAGKSSLVNKLVGEERVTVSSVPGTTRDAVDLVLRADERDFLLIDTAGMRKKGKIRDPLERYSVIRALRAIDRCDVVLLVVDATVGVGEQETRIAGYVREAGKGVAVVVNKWDLIAKTANTMAEFEHEYRTRLAFISYAPMTFVSALTGKRVGELIDIVEYIFEQSNLRIPTGVLNELVQDAVSKVQPPSRKGERLKILYTTQVGVRPPRFVFFVNKPELMHFSYKRYLENTLREQYGFHGTPIEIEVRKRT